MIHALSTLRTSLEASIKMLIVLILFLALRELYLHFHEKEELQKLAATERETSDEEVRRD